VNALDVLHRAQISLVIEDVLARWRCRACNHVGFKLAEKTAEGKHQVRCKGCDRRLDDDSDGSKGPSTP
jgi:hypothetical protein